MGLWLSVLVFSTALRGGAPRHLAVLVSAGLTAPQVVYRTGNLILIITDNAALSLIQPALSEAEP